jgi:hypothetical protein
VPTGHTIRAAREADVGAIHALHRANVLSVLDGSDLSGGFVRVDLECEDVVTIVRNGAAVVAVAGEELLGYYVLSGCADRPALISHLTRAATSLHYGPRPISSYRVGFGAQACVARPHRRRGLGTALFDGIVAATADRFEILFSSITRKNLPGRSYNLSATGWEIVSETDDRLFVVNDLRSR